MNYSSILLAAPAINKWMAAYLESAPALWVASISKKRQKQHPVSSKAWNSTELQFLPSHLWGCYPEIATEWGVLPWKTTCGKIPDDSAAPIELRLSKTSISWANSRLAKKIFQVTFVVHESESEVAQSCPTLCDPMDCSLPVSSVHGIF